MKLCEALEVLKVRAARTAAPVDLILAVETVLRHFDKHPVAEADDFFAAASAAKRRAALARATARMKSAAQTAVINEKPL